MLSKRANVFYLEHVRVMQRDNRIVYLTEGADGIDQFVSIPDKNTAFILLGKGTSITDAAVRKLAESNVLVGFCGSGGSPLFGCLDVAFMLPQDEYRPTAHAQQWFALWSAEHNRLEMGRALLRQRAQWSRAILPKLEIQMDEAVFGDFEARLNRCSSNADLLAAEAHYAKQLYAGMARQFALERFARAHGMGQQETPGQRVNAFLDHGNYLAYGYAAVALHGMGVPYFLPVLHGKTRRGALVFDIADLYKDWLIMPAAFKAGTSKTADNVFRARIIELALECHVLDKAMTFVSELPGKVMKNQ
ncbi:MAG: type I-F CRISPR-associated endonuclease Cas1f [Serpentinimonas sp.]|nr:type I-F CRISPR-associated endonuclease Cas1f [Serpentinimonas sp.]